MIVLDGASLTPREVQAVARGGEQVSVSAEARARNDAAREAIAARIAAGGTLYGATTGVGALRDREVTESEREQFQWNLLRSHAVSAGRPLAPELVRAGMVVRANQLGAGGAGVAAELLAALVAALNDGVVPVTRELGSLGTGDLPALSEVALALLDGAEVRLGLRDALGFISSNAFTAGHAALITIDARALQDAWLTVGAISFEALAADPVVLDERVQAARGASGQTAVAARMRRLLAGAAIDPQAGATAGPVVPGRLVQDPYPFRVLPQVDGVSWDAITWLERVVQREMNYRPENALIEGGEALANGNFHAAELAAALDTLRAALAQSSSLIAARVSALLDPRMSGLPPFLADRPGPDSGVMMLEYTAHAAAAEIRSLVLPLASQNMWASLGVESHGSLAATAARRTAEALASLRVLVATELVVAMRALSLAGRSPVGEGTRELFAAASAALPAGLEDREFGRDVELASALLGDWPWSSFEGGDDLAKGQS